MIRDTLNIEELVYLLSEVVTARKEMERARDAYDGWSWGYHGQAYFDAIAKASANFEDKLNEYIDARVALLLEGLNDDRETNPRTIRGIKEKD